MKRRILLILIAMTAVSCGAANNSERENRGDEDPPVGDRDQRAITIEEVRQSLNSQIFRLKGSPIYSYAQETDFAIPNNGEEAPATIYPIPSVGLHIQDEKSERPSTAKDCGADESLSSIDARIADCALKNANDQKAHLWNGRESGIAGEGNWLLVAKEGASSVWQDQRTGLLWSHHIKNATWDAASGNVSEAEQVCNPANSDFIIKSDEASWRLPTRGDFLQADLNGSRYALSTNGQGDDTFYWTANFAGNKQAWAIQQSTGVLSLQDAISSLAVRCVGNALK